MKKRSIVQNYRTVIPGIILPDDRAHRREPPLRGGTSRLAFCRYFSGENAPYFDLRISSPRSRGNSFPGTADGKLLALLRLFISFLLPRLSQTMTNPTVNGLQVSDTFLLDTRCLFKCRILHLSTKVNGFRSPHNHTPG